MEFGIVPGNKFSNIESLKSRVAALDRLCVRPKVAEDLLDIGHKQLYLLLARNELLSFKEGKARKITVASIEAYLRRKLQQYPKPNQGRPSGPLGTALDFLTEEKGADRGRRGR
ncbi:MAG TPA: hypothetical protein VH678_01930 [Xanthobacteraceae bacterium]|jgi:hypothetical protein